MAAGGIRTFSALALLVAQVRADHAHDILSFDDLAVFAQALDGGSDFHKIG